MEGQCSIKCFSRKRLCLPNSPAALLQKRLSHDLRQLLGGINISLWGISTNLRDICIHIWASDNCTLQLWTWSQMRTMACKSRLNPHFLYLKMTPSFGIWQFNSIQTTTNWDWNHIIIYSFGQNIFNPILASSFLHNFYKFVQSIKYIKVNYQALKWHSTLIYKEIIFFKSCKTAQLKVYLFVSVWLFAWPGFSSCRKIQREKRKDQLNQDVISFLASNKTIKVSLI